jgi:hypothetical protein
MKKETEEGRRSKSPLTKELRTGSSSEPEPEPPEGNTELGADSSTKIAERPVSPKLVSPISPLSSAPHKSSLPPPSPITDITPITKYKIYTHPPTFPFSPSSSSSYSHIRTENHMDIQQSNLPLLQQLLTNCYREALLTAMRAGARCVVFADLGGRGDGAERWGARV